MTVVAVEPVRWEEGRAMRLAGLRRHHDYAESARTIPEQWAAFRASGPIPGQVPGMIAYGVMCGHDAANARFEYMTAVEVASFDGLPEGMGRLRIAPRRYAVFAHDGPAATLRRTWEAIWNEWLPRSGLRGAHAPDFERYDERFDPATGTGGIEIWFPVE